MKKLFVRREKQGLMKSKNVIIIGIGEVIMEYLQNGAGTAKYPHLHTTTRINSISLKTIQYLVI